MSVEENVSTSGAIHLPMGLLGFEQTKNFTLIGRPEEAPFLWLQMLEEPRLAFLVVSPLVVIPNYQPDLYPEDAEFLGLKGAQDAMIFNIVTLHPDGRATVNLKGPVILNRHTLVGKQVVPANVECYDLQHPLPIAN